jgi:predicted phosphodiesterase
MKIAVCSDLHLEFGDLDLANDQDADVLVLGGDILLLLNCQSLPTTRVLQLYLQLIRFVSEVKGMWILLLVVVSDSRM